VAEEASKDPGATFYDVRTLNRWFLASVAAMTIVYVWSAVADHTREWKEYQRTFAEYERDLAIEQGRKAFAAAGGTRVLDGYASNKEGGLDPVTGSLRTEVEKLRALVEGDHEKRPELVKAFEDAEYEFNVVSARMKKAKADFEADRFHYEELAHAAREADAFNPQSEDVREAYERFLELKRDFERLDDESKAREEARERAKAALDAFDALANDVAKQLEEKEREVARMEKRADSVDPERWFNRFRNWIFVNFMAPTETPRKIVVNEIFDDLNFLRVPKVDMCNTCHLATDRNKDYPPGNAHVTFGTEKNPMLRDGDSAAFRSHSRPELFCTSLSPHPQDRFGCSGCHGGGNQRLSFELTWHTPTDEEEKGIWKDELHWHRVHEWDYPMLGSQFLDSSCYKCHTQQTHVPGATRWNRGRDLAAKLGCFGCHKMAPFEGERKVGPPLSHVVSKFSSLEFMLKWVDEPHSFRPTTRMPSFFHRENRAMEPGRDAADVTALVTFLYNLATPQPLRKYPGNGDAERGRQFLGEMGGVGCLGCHNIDDFRNEKADALRHGPDLSGIGSKVAPDWLFTWLLDPKSLWPGTNMPNLRLTEQEAADLVAYLMTKRNQAFEEQVFERPADDSIYERILEEKLTERMTTERARAEIAIMSGLEKRRRAGEFLLNHYGCFGCHDIPGYEDAKPIGTELNGWGSKHADRLDFGMVEMGWKAEGGFNRETWLRQKLANTRFFDRNKDKKPLEKLKMPQFAQLAGPDVDLHGGGEAGTAHAAERGEPAADPNAADREAVMTFVMSLVKDNTASSIQRQLTPAEAAVERGRRLVRQKNCVGCHVLYGEGGEIRLFQPGEEGQAFYPPVLDGQGARTQPAWLFSFLADPVQGKGRGARAHLRPWLHARMPTFGFTQEELNDVVAYFAHEEVWQTSVDRQLWNDLAARFRADFPGYDERTMRTAGADKQSLHQTLLARTYRRQGGRFLHDTDFPYLAPVQDLSERQHDTAKAFFEKLGCALCHAPGGRVPKGKTPADMAPDLALTRARLAPSWVKHWLGNPNSYQPGTRMPSLWPVENGARPSNHPDIGDADREMELIRDYLFSSRFAADFEEIARRTLVFEDDAKDEDGDEKKDGK
jgi:cbb3-type cytochrome oxidase cytochrome c subunit